MKKELAYHFIALLVFFLLLAVFKRWFNEGLIYLIIGGVIGTLLPDLDHFIYVYFLSPQELTSQRVASMVSRGEIVKSLDLLSETRYERNKLIFHTFMFQVVFVGLSFLVVSSSSNIFGKGLVLGFLLHLVVDQFIDLIKIDSLGSWFSGLNLSLDREKTTIFWLINLIIVLFFGFLF